MSPKPATILASALFGDVGFGAANLGNLHRAMTDDESWEVLEEAWDRGIRYFDTAPHYGLGLSERRVGAFLRGKPRGEYVLSTKAGRLLRAGRDGDLERVWDATADGIRTSLEESLGRLGLDRADILYLHDPEHYGLDSSLAEALPALAELRDDGVVGAIGVGSMSILALQKTAESGLADVLMVAGRYTLAEQTGIGQLRDTCDRTGVRLVTASVFNSGLLADPSPSAGSRYDYRSAPAELVAHAVRIAEVCRRHGVPLPAAALQYTARDPLVVSVVMGTGRPDQVRQNLEWMRMPIPHELWDELHSEGLVSAEAGSRAAEGLPATPSGSTTPTT